jgi:hypothetical protein
MELIRPGEICQLPKERVTSVEVKHWSLDENDTTASNEQSPKIPVGTSIPSVGTQSVSMVKDVEFINDPNAVQHMKMAFAKGENMVKASPEYNFQENEAPTIIEMRPLSHSEPENIQSMEKSLMSKINSFIEKQSTGQRHKVYLKPGEEAPVGYKKYAGDNGGTYYLARPYDEVKSEKPSRGPRGGKAGVNEAGEKYASKKNVAQKDRNDEKEDEEPKAVAEKNRTEEAEMRLRTQRRAQLQSKPTSKEPSSQPLAEEKRKAFSDRIEALQKNYGAMRDPEGFSSRQAAKRINAGPSPEWIAEQQRSSEAADAEMDDGIEKDGMMMSQQPDSTNGEMQKADPYGRHWVRGGHSTTGSAMMGQGSAPERLVETNDENARKPFTERRQPREIQETPVVSKRPATVPLSPNERQRQAIERNKNLGKEMDPDDAYDVAREDKYSWKKNPGAIQAQHDLMAEDEADDKRFETPTINPGSIMSKDGGGVGTVSSSGSTPCFGGGSSKLSKKIKFFIDKMEKKGVMEYNPSTSEPAQAIDHLTYSNYKANRQRSPGITPERWSKVYPNVQDLEAKYQSESLGSTKPVTPEFNANIQNALIQDRGALPENSSMTHEQIHDMVRSKPLPTTRGMPRQRTPQEEADIAHLFDIMEGRAKGGASIQKEGQDFGMSNTKIHTSDELLGKMLGTIAYLEKAYTNKTPKVPVIGKRPTAQPNKGVKPI